MVPPNKRLRKINTSQINKMVSEDIGAGRRTNLELVGWIAPGKRGPDMLWARQIRALAAKIANQRGLKGRARIAYISAAVRFIKRHFSQTRR